MKVAHLILSIQFAMLCSILQGQIDTGRINYQFDIEARAYYQSNREKDIPVHIDNTSNSVGSIIYPKFDTVTDNPFRHTAFYALLKNKISFEEKYSLEVDLMVEHRGMSYGLYDMKNIVFFPYYKFDFSETLYINDAEFDVSAKLGSFRNHKLQQGLRIYNIDYHAGIGNITWKKLFLQYCQIADLSHTIGLRLEEIHDLSIGYNAIDKNDVKLNFGINTSLNNYSRTPVDPALFAPFGLQKNDNGSYYYSNYGWWVEYSSRENIRLYAQYEIRNQPYFNIMENSGFLIGADIRYANSVTEINFNPEFRYYGWAYNYGNRYDSVSYRKNPSDISKVNYYGNTVGESLYPLVNFYNQFSQWAVYTEYQYQNIAGIELRARIKRKLGNKLSIEFDAESCTLLKEYKYNNKKTFTYLFYNCQFLYSLSNYFEIGLGINNKSMNLDKHYHTFYMREKPIFHFSIRCQSNSKK